MARKTTLTKSADFAYRGYSVKVSPFGGNCSISKSNRDGQPFHIAFADDAGEAKRIIDEIAD